MRRYWIVLSLCLMVWLGLWSQPAWAASSSGIRAVDEVAGKNYAGQNLQMFEFGDADLTEANFKGADLQGVVFNGATLTRANLQGVNFRDGMAYVTDFSMADLSNAIFSDAMLLKSNFAGVVLTGADFSDAILDAAQVARMCASETTQGTNPVTKVDTRKSLGCK
jgi:uncharacterized protein YjbI with pentapeptide repeats